MIRKETLIFALLLLFRCFSLKPVYQSSAMYETLFIEYENSLCSTQDRLSFQAELLENSQVQEFGDNNSYFGFNFDLIQNVSQGFGYLSKLYPKQAMAGAFFLGLVFVMIMVQLVLSIINLCCCSKRAELKDHHVSTCTKLMICFYVAYVAFFVVVIVYAAISGSKVKRSACYFSQVPFIAIVGQNIQTFQFVGLSQIQKTFQAFGGQILGFAPFNQNLTAINNLNLSQTGANTSTAANNIVSFYQERLILSSSSATSYVYPDLFNKMDTQYMEPINEEFSSLDQLSKEIQNMSSNAQSIITAPAGSQDPQENVQTYVGLLDNVIVKNSYYFQMLVAQLDYMGRYKKQFIAVLITFISVCLLIYLIFVIIIYQQNVKGKCYNCNLFVKFLIIFLVLLTIIVFLITLFFYVFSIFNSTVCNLSTQLLNIQDFSTILGGDDQDLASFLNQCIGSKATGNIMNGIYNNFQFAGIAQIMQGLYNSKINNDFVTASNGVPVSTADPITLTNGTLDGTYAASKSIADQLDNLNNIVSCASITFGLIANSTTTIKSVTDTTVLLPNQCYSQSAAEQVRSLLASSYQSVQTTFTGFSNELSSANTAFATNITDLQSAFTQMSPILTFFDPLFQNYQGFSQNFEQITDCRALRTVIVTAQKSVCGSLNGNLYLLMIFLFFITYLMFFLNCCFCCMLRKKPTEKGEEKSEE